MHTNHRRKNRYKYPGRRWYTALASYKRNYWTRERARERHLMNHERFEDLQEKHPKSILWEAL